MERDTFWSLAKITQVECKMRVGSFALDLGANLHPIQVFVVIRVPTLNFGVSLGYRKTKKVRKIPITAAISILYYFSIIFVEINSTIF